jgi:hypothetical protein
MKHEKQFTFKILPSTEGSMTFKVEEVSGRTVRLEEFLGVMAAYLHETCGELGLAFADDLEDEIKDFQ